MFDVLFNNIFLDSFCFLSFLLQRKSYIKVLERSRIHIVVYSHESSEVFNENSIAVHKIKETLTLTGPACSLSYTFHDLTKY